MFRIVLAALVVVAVMVLAKDGRVLSNSGLLSSCAVVATPIGQTGHWQSCRPGKLEGRPDLSRRSCTRQGIYENREFWRCPAPVATGNTAAR